jgi:hypothetical protein
MALQRLLVRSAGGLAVLLAAGWTAGFGQDVQSPYKVTIRDEKATIVEAALPIDPTPRIRYNPTGLGVSVNDEQGRTLHLSHFPTLNIDGNVTQAAGGPFGGAPGVGKFEKMNAPLGKTAGGRTRHGFQTVYNQGDLRITLTCEVSPTKAAGNAQKRRCDSMLIRYLVENKGNQPHKFGLRIYMDVYVITNDGALFAAPNQPGKILDGVVLKDKTLPDYVQMLERPDLQNPGFVSHLTLNLGSNLEKPDRVVLTRHGAGLGAWDMAAIMAMGDSACGVFWEPKEIKPGGKREIAYGYGQGVVLPPEGEGQFEFKVGGSFEPGKLFTVTALVSDPSPGQALTLELPTGMELVEGRSIQPVPVPPDDQANSVVMWRARVTQTGEFPLRIRSSGGVTQTKVVTIEKAQ